MFGVACTSLRWVPDFLFWRKAAIYCPDLISGDCHRCLGDIGSLVCETGSDFLQNAIRKYTESGMFV